MPTPTSPPRGSRQANDGPRAARIELESHPRQAIRGRGAADNPANRFDRIHLAPLPDEVDAGLADEVADSDAARPRTLALRDPSRSALTYNDSPDVPFEASLNPYRGCEHGCAYCYARPTHEYLGFSAGLDFETRILVKERAPELLRRELSSPRWKPQVIALSGVTDPYQPLERRLGLTRRCLEVLRDFRNPVGVITKNGLVTRDRDLLGELASYGAASVNVSITTLDPCLQRALEPRASHPDQRLRAIEILAKAGIPTGVMVAPVIPGLNDHEILPILEAAASAGAIRASHILLRVPHGLADLFSDWLTAHAPLRKEKVLSKLRAVRGGRLNDPRFGSRMRGEGVLADQIAQIVDVGRRRFGLDREQAPLSTDAFRPADGEQLRLL